jgi:hypothetical protein
MAFGARLTKRFETSPFLKFGLRISYFVIGFIGIALFFGSQTVADIIAEAGIIQQDFANNSSYTGGKYDVISTDLSPLGILKSFPRGLLIGIYRPFITESLSFSYIWNGLESILLIFLTGRFFLSVKLLKKMNKITKNEFLMFALIFVLIIGFMAGFTSIIFGVLVRIRAIILPFVFLLLTVKADQEPTKLTELKST